jgi:hypothetical protein
MPLNEQEKMLKDILRIIESDCWIPKLEVNELYSRIHDDADGTLKGSIGILISKVGDIMVIFEKPHTGFSLRFRHAAGGGKSWRTRNALAILAYAMKLDNEEEKTHQGQY